MNAKCTPAYFTAENAADWKDLDRAYIAVRETFYGGPAPGDVDDYVYKTPEEANAAAEGAYSWLTDREKQNTHCYAGMITRAISATTCATPGLMMTLSTGAHTAAVIPSPGPMTATPGKNEPWAESPTKRASALFFYAKTLSATSRSSCAGSTPFCRAISSTSARGSRST